MSYADQMPPQIAGVPFFLVVISIVAGVLMMLLFKVASNPAAIRRAKRRVQAQLLALRLFGDEPALVWASQMRLLTANIRYLGVVLVPVVTVAVPFVLAYPHLEALFGRAPLAVGSTTVLTVRLRQSSPDRLRLEMPSGLKAETPAVRIPGSGEISWRVRAGGPVSQPVKIHLGSLEVDKNVQVGTRSGYLSETRPASLLSWIFAPGETPIGSPNVESVHVAYRRQRLSAFGLEWPWEAWFILISVITALVVKSRLGVVF
ncbi:MAG TPA: hypothetical protein VKB88_41070 [Bryobacteraceae bacterium]|nr:hypothetical protein [Bryobacteraceae bacterium]